MFHAHREDESPEQQPSRRQRRPFLRCAFCCAVILCLISQPKCGGAQFVGLTVEIEVDQWDWWLFEDERTPTQTTGATRSSIFREPATVYCVIGINTWMMEGNSRQNSKVTRWFTGTNIIEQSVITGELSETDAQRRSRRGNLAIAFPLVGQQSTRIYQTDDGNPGRLVRVMDLMDLRGRILWLALCSGSALKREGRQVFPPSDLWKELLSAPSGFMDQSVIFEDDLGLPRSVKLLTPQDQLIFQYQVRQSTNVLGWNFPLEFYGVQYRPARTNGWELQLTFKGRVTAIGVGDEPQIPPTAEKTDEQ